MHASDRRHIWLGLQRSTPATAIALRVRDYTNLYLLTSRDGDSWYCFQRVCLSVCVSTNQWVFLQTSRSVGHMWARIRFACDNCALQIGFMLCYKWLLVFFRCLCACLFWRLTCTWNTYRSTVGPISVLCTWSLFRPSDFICFYVLSYE